jgi:flagellin
MASIINTNITSLVAQNNLSMTQATLQTTIERLSSGLRVNSAADDASGYAIANRMDAQIRGMAVATRNANDGISFSQTTTGALSQISNNLQRMRELAVQAANGSNSTSDTALLNQEFNQLQTEVARIQSSTSFNNVNVFQANDIVFQVGANTTSGDRVNMQGSPLTSTQAMGTQTITDRTATTAAADIATAITTASTTAAALTGTDATKIAFMNNATIDAINSNQKLSFAAKADLLNTLATLNNAYSSSKFTSASQSFSNFITDLNNTVGSSGAASNTVGISLLATATGTRDSTNSATGAILADAGGSTAAYAGIQYSVITGGIAAATTVIATHTTSVGAAGTSGTLLATQTAASGQSLALSAISAIDSALTEVNTASAMQGALQNRFTAVISNLTAFSQSQTAAKSRIVDADFAAETAKLSKNQILSQAGTAMLAQANQLPSGILSLLKNG